MKKSSIDHGLTVLASWLGANGRDRRPWRTDRPARVATKPWVRGSLAAAALLTLAADSVRANTVTWTGSGADAKWATAGNWQNNVAPASGDSLIFAGSNKLATNVNDIPNHPTFNGITFATGAGAFTLGGSTVDIKLNGDIVNNSSAAQTLNLQTTLAGTTHVSNTAGGSVALNYALLLDGGAVLDLQGNDVHVTYISYGTAGARNVTSAASATLNWSGAGSGGTGASYTYDGDISGPISVRVNSSSYGAAQIFTAPLSYTGSTTVDATSGNRADLQATSDGRGGQILNTSAIAVRNGGGMMFDYGNVAAASAHSILHRIADAVPFTLNNGGALMVRGSSQGGAADITETFTSANAPAIDGYGILGIYSYAANKPTAVQLPSLARNNRAVCLLRGNGLGVSDTGLARTAITIPTASAPALVGEGTGLGTQVKVVPWLMGDTNFNSTGPGRTLITTYDAGGGRTGFRTLADTEFVTNALSAAGADDNVALNLGTGLSGNAGKTIGALVIRYTGTENHTYSFAGSGTLTLKTGVLAFLGNTSIPDGSSTHQTNVTLDGFDALDFGGNEGILFANLRGYRSNGSAQDYNNWSQVTVNVPIHGANGLTKGGRSLLVINAKATYTGRTTVASGELKVADTDFLPTGTTVDLASGALLTIASAKTQTVAGVEGTGTVAGNLVVAAGGHVSPGHSLGTLTASNLTLSAGSALNCDLAGPGTNDFLATTGCLTLNGVVTLIVTDAGGLAAGTYTLVNYASLGGSMGSIATVGPAAFKYVLHDTGSAIQLVVTKAVNGTAIVFR